MKNSLNGKFYDDKGNEIFVCESYVKFSDPPIIYRRDSKGNWRGYSAVKRGKKTVYRAMGFRIPLFAK